MEKKVVVNIFIIAVAIILIVCFCFLLKSAINYWAFYINEINSEIPVQEFIDAYFNDAIEATVLCVILGIAFIANLVVLILIDKTDLLFLSSSFKEYFEDKKASAKQKKIEALKKELDALQNENEDKET